jgi:hypothetical protein
MKVTIVAANQKDTNICVGGVLVCVISQYVLQNSEEFQAFSRLKQELIGVHSTFDDALDDIRDHLEEEFINLEWPNEKPVEKCTELDKLLKAEIDIIKKHLSRHKYFQHITDEQLATIDFAKKYGWIMKELFCINCCTKRNSCQHAKDLKSGKIEQNPFELE